MAPPPKPEHAEQTRGRQIQMTPVVISGTCMGSVEMEPCGMGTTEQCGVSSYPGYKCPVFGYTNDVN